MSKAYLIFFINPKTQLTKISLGSDGKTKQIYDPIKLIKVSNIVELSNDIDENTWIDHIISFAFDCFITNDDLHQYLGAHSKLHKSNEK